MRSRLMILPLAIFATACGDAPIEAPLEPEGPRAAALACAVFHGTAEPISDSPKFFEAVLAGELAGTLRILPTGVRATGAVEHHEGTFVLDRQAGEVLFGDGIRGRRIPTGSPADGRQRYHASGAITEWAAETGAVREAAEGHLWIGGELGSGGAALQYRVRLCDSLLLP